MCRGSSQSDWCRGKTREVLTGTLVLTCQTQFAASSNATIQSVKAKREVIAAAGTLHTPQLLQVSGIGDPALLGSINVPTVVDLPAVGQNLHDHVSVAVVNASEYSFPKDRG